MGDQGATATTEQQGTLRNVYMAFTHCVSLLGEHGNACGRLEDVVAVLFKFQFLQHSEVVVNSFTSLLCNMVSMNNIFLRPVLDMLTRNFLPIPREKIYRPPAPALPKAADSCVTSA